MMLPRLLLFTDRSQLPLGASLLATLRECVAAGATTVVVRELDLPERQRAALCGEVARLGATVIAAQRPLPGAVGVHLPAGCNAGLSSLDPRCTGHSASTQPRQSRDPRQSGTSQQWHGRSCHTAEEVRRAAAAGAAYATLSPYAASASKPGYGPPLPSAEFVGHAIPVYALGGISPQNAGASIKAGAHGVAVMGVVMRSLDPGATVARLLEEVDR
jgi:thiamine-phosphate pyrophosphorylase